MILLRHVFLDLLFELGAQRAARAPLEGAGNHLLSGALVHTAGWVFESAAAAHRNGQVEQQRVDVEDRQCRIVLESELSQQIELIAADVVVALGKHGEVVERKVELVTLAVDTPVADHALVRPHVRQRRHLVGLVQQNCDAHELLFDLRDVDLPLAAVERRVG